MFDILRKKFSSIVKKTVKEVKKAVKTAPEKKQKKTKPSKKSDKSKKQSSKTKNKEIESVEENQKVEEKIEDIKIETEEKQEEKIVEEKSGFGFFSKIKNYLTQHKLTQSQFDEAFEELELILLENNVALESVDAIKDNLSKQLVEKDIKKDKVDEILLESLKEAITSVIQEPPNILENIKQKDEPYTILFFGINGTGKTTSIAKIANMLKKNKISCVIAAADTFRAAAIEQIKTHAEKLEIPLISGNYGADPASIAFDAIQYAKKHKIKCVLIDTAGRMYTKENLIREMDKIVRVSKPDLKLFVGESITGNDATEQTRTFNDSIGIDGIILTKADIDEKAGTILSVSQVTGKPIYFLGTGQKYEDIEIFTKKTVLKNLGLD